MGVTGGSVGALALAGVREGCPVFIDPDAALEEQRIAVVDLFRGEMRATGVVDIAPDVGAGAPGKGDSGDQRSGGETERDETRRALAGVDTERT